MPIRTIINGATGKMGQLAVKTLTAHSDFLIVAETTRDHNLKEAINQSQADIVLDLTNAEVVWKNTLTIIENGAHPVIGTSGLLPHQIEELTLLCQQKKLGGLIVPNFSIGAVLMMKYASEMAKYLPDVEILEMHHPNKLDSPSGTALRTAELISKSKIKTIENKNYRETIPHCRGGSHENIPIHSVRLPGLLAHQQIIFGGVGETLTIRHDSIDRLCFMPGVVLACQKVIELNTLVCGLENIL